MASEASAAWAARRALVEGAAATPARVAAACRVSLRALEARAQREGWTLSGAAGGLSRAERVARIHDRLLDKVERTQLQAEEDPAFDKASIAELSATARTLARISEITRDEDGAKEKQMERDADIAAILDRLDARARRRANSSNRPAAAPRGGSIMQARSRSGSTEERCRACR